MKKIFGFIFIVFYMTAALAGSENGNGARAIKIKNGKRIKEVVLTELWEATQPFFVPEMVGNQNHYKVMEPEKGASWEKVYDDRKKMFLDLAREGGFASKTFADLYEAAEAELATYPVRYFGEDPLCREPADVVNRVLPPLFEVFQAIYTHIPTPKEPYKLMCFSKVFNQYADSVNLAAAKFHENAYYVGATEFNQLTSDATRILGAIVFGTDFEQMSAQRLETILEYYGKGLTEDRTSIVRAFGEGHPLLAEIWKGQFLEPEKFPTQLGQKSNQFYLAYAFETDRPWWLFPHHLSLGDLSRVHPSEYTCHGPSPFYLHKETYSDRGLGNETQLFVLPASLDSFRFAPGSRWFPHGDSEMSQKETLLTSHTAHFAGPLPFSVFQFSEDENPFAFGQINQLVEISKDLQTVLYSFGGHTGTCTKNN